MDLVQALRSLGRYSAAQQEGHFKQIERLYKCIKAEPEKWIKLDITTHTPFRELGNPVKGKLVAWKDLYDTEEEVDFSCPFSNGMLGLKTTV